MVHFYFRVLVFLIGIVIGLLVGKYCVNVEVNQTNFSTNPSYDKWSLENNIKRKNVIWDTLRYNKNVKTVIEADFLFKKATVTCLVLLRNYKNEKPIGNTWAKGCNEIKFIKIPKQQTISIKRKLGNSSWVLLCNALHDTENSDWIFIVNDYTFVIMENLRYYLAPLNPNDKYYLGHSVIFWTTQFNSKEGGILLSKGALSTFKNHVAKSNCSSFSYWNREDFYLGKTLATLGIVPNDTRDYGGFSRFHPFNLNALLFSMENHKYTNVFPFKCCSKDSISFQAIDGDKMYFYYYVLYTMQIFTHGKLGNVPNLQNQDEEVWKAFLNERNISNTKITSAEYYKEWEHLIDDPTSFAAKMEREIEKDGEL